MIYFFNFTIIYTLLFKLKIIGFSTDFRIDLLDNKKLNDTLSIPYIYMDDNILDSPF